MQHHQQSENTKSCGQEGPKIALGEELFLGCISVLDFVARYEVQIPDYVRTQMKFDLLIPSKTQEDLLIISVTFQADLA